MITGLEIDPHQQERLERDLQDQGPQQLGLQGHQEDQQLQDLQGELGTQGPLEDPEPLNVKNQDHQGDQGALNDKSQDPLNEPKILDPQEDQQAQMPPLKNNIGTNINPKLIQSYDSFKKALFLQKRSNILKRYVKFLYLIEFVVNIKTFYL